MYEDRKDVQPATTIMRSPDVKTERGDDGGKDVGSSGNDEERKMEVLCVQERKGERRQGTEDGGGIQDAVRRRRRKE